MTGRRLPLALVAGVVLTLLAAAPAFAHSEEAGTGISVEPESAQAGDSVVLAGKGLEPNSDRVLVLAGPDVTIDLGTVTTDSDGMFQKEIKLPAHLPGGAYEFRAIGDETLATPLAMTAAPGMGSDSAAGTAPNEVVQPYRPGTIEQVLLVGGAAVLLVLGGILVWGAERVGHSGQPPVAA